MKFNPILIVAGEPNSVFLEIFFKSIESKKIKNPIILIASLNLVKLQMKKLKVNIKINILTNKKIKFNKIEKKTINIVNVNYKQNKPFEKISKKSNKYISNSFKVAFELMKKNKIDKLINGPINKKTFLNKKHLGITEYISKKFKIKKTAMLIYNKKLSVCPLTTHVPLKYVANKINKKNIIEKVKLIDEFFKFKLNKKPKIAVLGLNPHCETVEKIGEEQKIIIPAINVIKKSKIFVKGPFSADTFFIEKNINKYDVVIGMYHDQVLTPLKTLFNFNAINLTIGLPFIRVSPDHGPNSEMYGKNKSDPASIYCAMKFFNKV